MKAIVICPDRPGLSAIFGHREPAALTPLLGATLLGHCLDALAEAGAKHVLILASDRPERIRAAVGQGERWGLRVEVLAESREFTADEARAKYRGDSAEGWQPAGGDVLVADRLPDTTDSALDSPRAWLACAQAWLPRAHRRLVGMREASPGVWVALDARLEPGAKLRAPCWVGRGAWIRARATVGPAAMVEEHAIIEPDAEVTESWIGPRTAVGAMAHVNRSLAWGNRLCDWQTGSCLDVPDAFLLADLRPPAGQFRPSWPGRAAALLALLATSPVALLAWLRRPRPMTTVRRAVPPGALESAAPGPDYSYRELTAFRGLWKRWPRLWNIVRGEFAWIGNPPLTREEAATLATDFDRLWLAAPIGLFSLADAEGAAEGMGEEARAHAAFYGAQASPRLNRQIFRRLFFRVCGGLFRRAPKPALCHEHHHANS